MAIKRMNVKPRPVQLYINTDTLVDIPTCDFITGMYGETIINGGIGPSTGVVGPANIGKTVFTDNLLFAAANTIMLSTPTYISIYDTENSVKDSRKDTVASMFPELPTPITDPDTGILDITDKTQYYADEWMNIYKEFTNEIIKDKGIVWAGIINKHTKKPIETKLPTFTFVDSMTEFEPKVSADAIAKSKLEDGGLNTINLRNGLYKNRVLGELPSILSKSNNRFFTTAHIGGAVDMNSSPYAPKPTKKLNFLKEGETIKGVSPKFFFLLSTVYMLQSMSILKNQSTKLPEYPLPGNASNQETDLALITVTILRSKTGPSGVKLPFVSSQEYGILNVLSHFHFIKSNGKFGLEGNDRSYNLIFMPSVKLSRTTVRGKIEPLLSPKLDIEDTMSNIKDIETKYKLQRAVILTSQLLQLSIFKQEVVTAGLWCNPDTLYKDIIALGYDWDILLNSRGIRTPDNYKEDIKPQLTIMDLLKMRKGLYHPYWLAEDKKTILEPKDYKKWQ